MIEEEKQLIEAAHEEEKEVIKDIILDA